MRRRKILLISSLPLAFVTIRTIFPHMLDYQLERFITDRPVPEMSTLSALAGEDSELLMAVLDGLTNFRNSVRADGNMLMASKVKHAFLACR